MERKEGSSCTVIIPVRDNWDLTAACLRSLREHTEPEVMLAARNYAIHVIVVDNGSTDATLTDLHLLGSELFGQALTVLRFDERLNFSRACNRGAAAAKTRLLFFLNNDTLLTPGWLPPLIDALEENDTLGAVGPLLLYPDDSIQHMGITCSPAGLAHIYRLFPSSHPVASSMRSVQALTAAALLIRAESFVRCGGFFEDYANGFEDVELSCRIRQRGQRLAMAPASRVYHLEGKSRGRNMEDDSDNGKLLFSRCGDALYYDYHLHAQKDGYCMALTDTLTPYLCLNPIMERELNARHRNGAPGDWVAALKEEPLWRSGYDWLVDYLVAHREFKDALALAVKRSNFFPRPANYAQTVKVAILAGEAELAEEIRALTQEEENALKDQELLVHRARRIADGHDSRADEPLQSIYRHWLLHGDTEPFCQI